MTTSSTGSGSISSATTHEYAPAAKDALDDAELDRISARLDRFDTASPAGPWNRQTLQLIADHPGVRAPDLAVSVGHETIRFKTDVRKLKELGLTESLLVGYRLSPRGEAFRSSGRSPL